VRDPSGVASVTFGKEGDGVASERYNGEPTVVDTVEFSVDDGEQGFDLWSGSAVEMTAADVHETSRGQIAGSRPNLVGELTEIADEQNVTFGPQNNEIKTTEEAVRDELQSEGYAGEQYTYFDAGKASGFTTSLGDTPRGVIQGIDGTTESARQFANGPLQYLSGLKGVVRVLFEKDLMLPLLRAFKQTFAQKQAINNPFDPKTERAKYSEYEAGWYAGYVIGEVSKLVASGAGSFALKGAVKGSTLATKLDDALTQGSRAYRAAKRLKRTKDAVEAKTTTAVLRGVGEAGSGVVRGARTVGTKIRTSRLVSRAGVDSKLSDGRAAALRAYLKRGGDESADDVDDLDDSEVADAFSIGSGCGPSAASARAALSARECTLSLSDEEKKDLYRAAAASDVDAEKLDDYLEGLSRDQQDAATEIIEGVDSGEDLIVLAYKQDRGSSGGSSVFRFFESDTEEKVEFVDSLEPEYRERLFKLGTQETPGSGDLPEGTFDELRENLMRFDDPERTEQLLKDLAVIDDQPGVDSIIKDIAEANNVGDGDKDGGDGNVDGALQEARVGAVTDKRIDEISKELGEKGDGEIDYVFEDGTLGESKAKDASGWEINRDREVFNVADQIAGWERKGGIDLDGRNIIVYVKKKPEKEDGVANSIEEYVKSETGSDVTVKFKKIPETE
jgi:hypothetical protein